MIKQIGFRECKSVWNQIFPSNSLQAPFYTWEWHNNWYNAFGASTQPLCLIVDDIIVAPLIKNGSCVSFSGGDEIADYLDIIGQDENKASAWEQILTYLADNNVTSLTIRNIPQNSSTVTFFRHQKNATVTREDTTPRMVLPGSWSTYINTLPKKERHELERKIRKFEREHPDAQITASTKSHKDITEFFDLMAKDPEKNIFLTQEMKTFFSLTAETFQKNISLLFVSMGDKKAAATLALVWNNTYYLYNSGFDKDCCANAGFYLTAKSIEYALTHGIGEYNFLQGNERYKYELGGKDFTVFTITWHA